MRCTPLARIASSTLKVAMVFCSQVPSRVVGAEAHVGVGREVEDEVVAGHGACVRRGRSSRSPSTSAEPRCFGARLEELALAGGEVVVAR